LRLPADVPKRDRALEERIVPSGDPKPVRELRLSTSFGHVGGLIFGMTMLIAAGALFYFGDEAAGMFGSVAEADNVAAAMAVLGIAMVLVRLWPVLRVFKPKQLAHNPSAIPGGRGRLEAPHLPDLTPYKGNVVLELFQPKADEQESEMTLMDAVRRAFAESQTSPEACFASAFGKGPDDIAIMYATFFAEHVPIYGSKPPSTAVVQVFLTAPPKEFQIEDGALMRVSRDREHGFHRIVSKYFAGS